MDLVFHPPFTLLNRHGSLCAFKLGAGFGGRSRGGGLHYHFTQGATTDRPGLLSPTWSSSSPHRWEYFQY